MIKDRFLKWIAIPSLGFLVPYLSGLTDFRSLNSFVSFVSLLLFVITSFLVWQGSVYIIAQIRSRRFCHSLGLKIFSIIVFTALYAFLLSATMTLLWQLVFTAAVKYPVAIKTALVCSAVAVFFSMIYEIMFLSKEREIDLKVVNHLDKELQHAEMSVLKNELDPHFVYNSLMPLYYLVKNDVQKAEQFAYKLIQVYQYFVEHRRSDFISLSEELHFINNYLFLLQIRFRNSISLQLNIKKEMYDMMVLPFSLQTLIENAIKHNSFDVDSPLLISVYTEKASLVVSNKMCLRGHSGHSNRIGLQNLRARYRILCNGSIAVIKHKDLFIVKLPMIKNARSYDISSYNRR